MKPDPQRIEAIFTAALARAPGDRVAFLAESCAGDPELRRRIEALLQAHAEAGSFLKQPLDEPASAVQATMASQTPTRRQS